MLKRSTLFSSLQLGSASGSSSPEADCFSSKEIEATRSPPKEDLRLAAPVSKALPTHLRNQAFGRACQ